MRADEIKVGDYIADNVSRDWKRVERIERNGETMLRLHWAYIGCESTSYLACGVDSEVRRANMRERLDIAHAAAKGKVANA